MFRRKDAPSPHAARLEQQIRESRRLLARRFANVRRAADAPAEDDAVPRRGVIFSVFEALGKTNDPS